MKSRSITFPELGMIAGTRAAMGAGIGLLLAGRLDESQRRAVGWTLFGVGLISTIPLLAEVLSHKEPQNGRSSALQPSSTRELQASFAGI